MSLADVGQKSGISGRSKLPIKRPKAGSYAGKTDVADQPAADKGKFWTPRKKVAGALIGAGAMVGGAVWAMQGGDESGHEGKDYTLFIDGSGHLAYGNGTAVNLTNDMYEKIVQKDTSYADWSVGKELKTMEKDYKIDDFGRMEVKLKSGSDNHTYVLDGVQAFDALKEVLDAEHLDMHPMDILKSDEPILKRGVDTSLLDQKYEVDKEQVPLKDMMKLPNGTYADARLYVFTNEDGSREGLVVAVDTDGKEVRSTLNESETDKVYGVMCDHDATDNDHMSYLDQMSERSVQTGSHVKYTARSMIADSAVDFEKHIQELEDNGRFVRNVDKESVRKMVSKDSSLSEKTKGQLQNLLVELESGNYTEVKIVDTLDSWNSDEEAKDAAIVYGIDKENKQEFRATIDSETARDIMANYYDQKV